MLSCKEAIRLVSEKQDHALPIWRRLSLRLHVLMCRACSRYTHQIQTLDDAISQRYCSGPPEESPEQLSEETRERIKASLHCSTPDSDSQRTE